MKRKDVEHDMSTNGPWYDKMRKQIKQKLLPLFPRDNPEETDRARPRAFMTSATSLESNRRDSRQ